MHVSKWGNSLAIRLPKKLVEEMGLKEGDEVNLVKAAADRLHIAKRNQAEAVKQALLRMQERGWEAPDDYKFDREEANER